MRSPSKIFLPVLLGAGLLALYPALAQKSPQSILPPGFGEPEPQTAVDRAPDEASPKADVTAPLEAPSNPGAAPQSSAEPVDGNAVSGEDIVAAPLQDLPPEARRSLDRVGLLEAGQGGLGPAAFGTADGRYLATLMDRTRAPIASRWLSILLRRTLLSQSTIPANIDGADWVGHRAWLLVRMGEADSARTLVQRVDVENQTPWLQDVVMQAALATADPAALCGLTQSRATQTDRQAWILARAMCAGISGEGGTASSLVSEARNSGRAGGIDVLLAEKVAGAGTNTRRAINIQWDGVDRLTAWRFGLAAATGVTIPEALFATAGPQARGWAARAPLWEPSARAAFADRAATLGVLSSAALVDLYGSIYDAADPGDRSGTTAAMLRAAYTGEPPARLAALGSLWSSDKGSYQNYARAIMTARAAAMVPLDATSDAAMIGLLVNSMLSAGLDLQAERWAVKTDVGSLGWALLAVGSPRPLSNVNADNVGGFGTTTARGRLLLAGLAGLGRLSGPDVAGLVQDTGLSLQSENRWVRALGVAVANGQQGTVVLLCAAGLQTNDWASVPPVHLYRIVDALRRVGLEAEARMIAAEAIARS